MRELLDEVVARRLDPASAASAILARGAIDAGDAARPDQQAEAAGRLGGRDAQRMAPRGAARAHVPGIGFIGGGLIFVRRDAVRGLTTAAGVWVTAAVGLAAGAGLAILATATTVAYFVVAFAFPPLARRLPRPRTAVATLQVTYADGRGVLREAIARCTDGAGSRWRTSPRGGWCPATARTRER